MARNRSAFGKYNTKLTFFVSKNVNNSKNEWVQIYAQAVEKIFVYFHNRDDMRLSIIFFNMCCTFAKL